MVGWLEGTVTALGRTWPGARELTVRCAGDGRDGGIGGGHEAVVRPEPADGVDRRALAYPELVGDPQVGDRVLLNVNAQALGLGTGGYALVVAIPDRLPGAAAGPGATAASAAADPSPPGHMVKARYTPLQTVVLGVDEQDSPHHELLRDADDLAGLPVVTADLHSALPAVCAAVLHDRPGTRIAYVMTDGGALPLWFSRTVAGLRAAGWLCGSVTVGQAFGGDLEAVTLHTGLLAARHVLGAQIAVVCQGPGNLGTGTKWGFTGVACGEAVNAVAALNGRPFGVLRVSEADSRERHRGLSHHSLTAYGRVALAPADLALPDESGAFWDGVRAQAEALTPRHRLRAVPAEGLDAALAASPVALSTMGRDRDQDRANFLAAACAGRLAAAATR
ncbi:DUF3866 family protein [Actinospica durhamensis]|uniref:DUF3866 family protein n=1 Tax=Actinospica durhamensis TaxID=1508375 RepID=A0A941IM14_9ACTN|nr:DUF3866 family protein [Actinospica durhamensis]MBR7833640.1 DUF3866 family protein [Actinospica durhamensis]